MVKNILMVGCCDKCKKETILHISEITYRIDQQIKDAFEVNCLMCGFFYNIDTVPRSFNNIFSTNSDTPINIMLPITTRIYSENYIISDLYYLLTMFNMYHRNISTKIISEKDVFKWNFDFRLPDINGQEICVSIYNMNPNEIYITSNNGDINEEEIRKNLDILFAYIIAFCDDKTNGYITTLITIRSLGDDMENRIKSYKSNINTKYGWNTLGSTQNTVTKPIFYTTKLNQKIINSIHPRKVIP